MKHLLRLQHPSLRWKPQTVAVAVARAILLRSALVAKPWQLPRAPEAPDLAALAGWATAGGGGGGSGGSGSGGGGSGSGSSNYPEVQQALLEAFAAAPEIGFAIPSSIRTLAATPAGSGGGEEGEDIRDDELSGVPSIEGVGVDPGLNPDPDPDCVPWSKVKSRVVGELQGRKQVLVLGGGGDDDEHDDDDKGADGGGAYGRGGGGRDVRGDMQLGEEEEEDAEEAPPAEGEPGSDGEVPLGCSSPGGSQDCRLAVSVLEWLAPEVITFSQGRVGQGAHSASSEPLISSGQLLGRRVAFALPTEFRYMDARAGEEVLPPGVYQGRVTESLGRGCQADVCGAHQEAQQDDAEEEGEGGCSGAGEHDFFFVRVMTQPHLGIRGRLELKLDLSAANRVSSFQELRRKGKGHTHGAWVGGGEGARWERGRPREVASRGARAGGGRAWRCRGALEAVEGRVAVTAAGLGHAVPGVLGRAVRWWVWGPEVAVVASRERLRGGPAATVADVGRSAAVAVAVAEPRGPWSAPDVGLIGDEGGKRQLVYALVYVLYVRQSSLGTQPAVHQIFLGDGPVLCTALRDSHAADYINTYNCPTRHSWQGPKCSGRETKVVSRFVPILSPRKDSCGTCSL
ncbi:hypothetical protein VOLCADRAFT_96534 [Volvox carteri f. nagariensis]|uniref:Uncharacterized protein n=1 Tax=Volvox carteri f. nagariensis TaxID=3068 RepID=D8UAC9_VOLCA|nr:uncharacterized protein VOLCADRAFT_96534 [Volvox carteri f. nagariensis]EFJ43293.1 hypothetical protein VOLCADRAFT_96534 [Volvox carteri f. nagariensis]|eukprot:XP_002955653.1 hypothetical protein VOLCADRAFT_96534 [Volvox carteri f. nagariensis]